MKKAILSLAIAVAVVAVSFGVISAATNAYSNTHDFPCVVTAPDLAGQPITFMSGTCKQLDETSYQFTPQLDVYYTFRSDRYDLTYHTVDIRQGSNTIRFEMYQADPETDFFPGSPYIVQLLDTQGFRLRSSSSDTNQNARRISIDLYAAGLNKITVIGSDIPYKNIGIKLGNKPLYFQ